MKRVILLFICCCISIVAFSQAVVIRASGAAGSYITGSATASSRTDDNILVTSTTQNGYCVFDLSSIPVGSSITSCTLGYYVSSFAPGVSGVCNTYGYVGDLSLVTTPPSLFADITSGILLFSGTSPANGGYRQSVGRDSLTSNTAPFTAFIQANIGNKISIGFSGGGTNVYTLVGETGNITSAITPPYLTVHYSGPCTGTPAAGNIVSTAPSACTSSTITVTNTTYYYNVGGLSFQWQSSPDSLTWSNISGATSSTYTFVGISSTTYFRNNVTCVNGNITTPSPGYKMTYLPCCTGTPSTGTTVTGTTTCNACSLTLDVPGYTPLAGLTYQWQSSPDNITWTNILQATTLQYTFSPYGAFYYRCKITCTLTGLINYSSSALVNYVYHILADTVANSTNSYCVDPVFYTKVNGYSPALKLKIYYGDGIRDSLGFINDTVSIHLLSPHTYYLGGNYTIKQVLYNNNVPQDSASFIYHYSACKTFSTTFYADLDMNCLKDDGDPILRTPSTIIVDSATVPIDTISVTSGFYYKVYGPVGTIYTFRMLSSAIHISCPATGILRDTVLATVNNYNTKYIGVACTINSPLDLSVSAMIPVTGLIDQWGDIYVSNTSCTPVNATITLYHSPKYAGAPTTSPTASSISGSTIIWNVVLSEFTSPLDLYYAVWAGNTQLTIGDTVQTHITVTPTSGDINPANNSVIIIDTAKAGCDPNFIEVSPATCFLTDTQFQYSIHFENTGNDTAHNIYVLDTLSDLLDPRSLEIVVASARMDIQQLKDGGYNVVRFSFPQINLLDSSHHGLCDGAVIYTIKNKAGIPAGSEIRNRAGIYFDINDVVMTNEILNAKGCWPAAIAAVADKEKLSIYPNPTTTTLTIKTTSNTYTSCAITNSIGQTLLQQPLSDTTTTLDVRALSPGLYYITVKGDSGSKVQKFVKL